MFRKYSKIHVEKYEKLNIYINMLGYGSWSITLIVFFLAIFKFSRIFYAFAICLTYLFLEFFDNVTTSAQDPQTNVPDSRQPINGVFSFLFLISLT